MPTPSPLFDFPNRIGLQRQRLQHALLASCGVLFPAMLALSFDADAVARPLALATLYGLFIALLAPRLMRATLLALPAAFAAGQWLHANLLVLGALLAVLLALQALSSRRGWHKGVQFWVFMLLLGQWSPPAALPPWLQALAMLAGSAWGMALAATLLPAWRSFPPRASPRAALHYGLVMLTLALLLWTASSRLQPLHGYWLPILALGMCDPSAEQMGWLGRERVIGTLYGAVAAWLLGWLPPTPLWHALLLILVLSATLMMMGKHFRGFIAGLTLLVLTLQPPQLFRASLLERLLDTVACALAVSAVAWLVLRWQGRGSPQAADAATQGGD